MDDHQTIVLNMVMLIFVWCLCSSLLEEHCRSGSWEVCCYRSCASKTLVRV
ncbi:hypothetical protein Hdeb2414_s0008g00296681 [Helianthus debilis subsp. tardiflorus]